MRTTASCWTTAQSSAGVPTLPASWDWGIPSTEETIQATWETASLQLTWGLEEPPEAFPPEADTLAWCLTTHLSSAGGIMNRVN